MEIQMKLLKGFLLMLAQFVCMAIISYVMFNTLWLSRLVYNICMWGLWPVVGLFSAYRVTVRGVNNFLAWIAPPLAGLAAHYLAFFFLPPSAGPFFICALTSVVGAATGDVYKKLKTK